jgi:hypothetical protein
MLVGCCVKEDATGQIDRQVSVASASLIFQALGGNRHHYHYYYFIIVIIVS